MVDAGAGGFADEVAALGRDAVQPVGVLAVLPQQAVVQQLLERFVVEADVLLEAEHAVTQEVVLDVGVVLEALARARPTYATASLSDRLPARPGEVVVDDATEAVTVVRVRSRRTDHRGENARASGGS